MTLSHLAGTHRRRARCVPSLFSRALRRRAFNPGDVNLQLRNPRTSLALAPFAFANAWLPPCSCAEHRMHRHRASPLRRHTAVHQCDASGVALCRGCAAALSPTPIIQPFLFLRQDEDLPLIPVLLPTIVSVSPIRVLNSGDPLRGRALRCNLRCAPISAAIPVASAPFGRCAVPLPGGSLRSPPFAWSPTRCLASAHRRFHRRSRSRWRCAPRSSPAAPSRIGSARRRSLSRTPPCSPRASWRPLRRRGGSPSVPFPEPHPLSFGTLDQVYLTAYAARHSHPTHCQCNVRMAPRYYSQLRVGCRCYAYLRWESVSVL